MIEYELRDIIIKRYGSLSKFAESIEMPWTTLDGVLKRGVNKANITSLIKICKGLNIDCESLYYGRLLPKQEMLDAIPLDTKEQEHIKKYRSLDTLDKKAVDGLLDTLSERTKQSETEHIQEPNPDYQYLIDKDKLYMTQYDYGVSAGIGNYLDEWDVPKTTVQIADSPTARKADYILKVDGDSMMPKFDDGDRVFVKAQETVEINEIGIFVIDGTCFLKQFKGDCLHSINPTYDDIALNEFQNIKCVGKVIGKV